MKTILICFRENTEIYIDGLPIGIIKDNSFEIHQNKNNLGEKFPIALDIELLEKVSETIQIIRKDAIIAESYKIS